VKASKGSIGRAVDQPDAKVRFYLFYGPDEGQSRALAARLLDGLGATRTPVTASAIKSGTASLADEAGAMSLFGGARLIWVEPAGDEIAEGVAAMLDGAAPESAVVAIGGALRKTSALVKLAEGSPAALAFASYAPEGEEAERMVIDLGRRSGLKIDPALAARIADQCSNDQAVAGREIEKLAIYLDASPNSPRELDRDALDAVGAEGSDSGFLHLADLALLGEVAALGEAIERLPAAGAEAIPVVRSLQRRVLMLAPLRARVERGERPDAVMTSLGRQLFWKDKESVSRMIRKWKAADLAMLGERAGALERTLLFTDAPVREALGEELLAIGRKARSL
jgi:DNA polymerase-3 subunit delta